MEEIRRPLAAHVLGRDLANTRHEHTRRATRDTESLTNAYRSHFMLGTEMSMPWRRRRSWSLMRLLCTLPAMTSFGSCRFGMRSQESGERVGVAVHNWDGGVSALETHARHVSNACAALLAQTDPLNLVAPA